jgi:hypothetical protein
MNFFCFGKNFRIYFPNLNLKNFKKHVMKFLYNGKNEKMEGRKETRGVGREKSVPFTLYVIRAKISSDFYTPKIEPNLASILPYHQ